jgi:hypothetical protein
MDRMPAATPIAPTLRTSNMFDSTAEISIRGTLGMSGGARYRLHKSPLGELECQLDPELDSRAPSADLQS